MADQKFNEAEQYLLQHWEMAGEVEDSMDEVRNKYQALFERIAQEVRESQKELDYDLVEVTRIGGPLRSGGIILGRTSWPSEGKNSPTGFWVENLRLELLVDREAEEPTVGFWLFWNDEADNDFYESAAKAVKDAAKKRLTSEQLNHWKFGDSENAPLVGRRIASKQALLDMISKGDTDRFVDVIVEQLEELAALIQDIDEIFNRKAKTGR